MQNLTQKTSIYSVHIYHALQVYSIIQSIHKLYNYIVKQFYPQTNQLYDNLHNVRLNIKL